MYLSDIYLSALILLEPPLSFIHPTFFVRPSHLSPPFNSSNVTNHRHLRLRRADENSARIREEAIAAVDAEEIAVPTPDGVDGRDAQGVRCGVGQLLDGMRSR